jgi:hypothetical protein
MKCLLDRHVRVAEQREPALQAIKENSLELFQITELSPPVLRVQML